MRISDWSSDVCSSDLIEPRHLLADERDDAGLARALVALREVLGVARHELLRHGRLQVGLQQFEDRLAVHVSRSEEHTSELQSLMRISYAVFCLKKKKYYTKCHTPLDYIAHQCSKPNYNQRHIQHN